MCPDAAITVTVETSVMAMSAVRNPCMVSQESSNPTAAGTNMTGNIDMRNMPASFTADTFMTPVQSAVKRIAIPYMLAGTGRGMSLLSSSPASDIARIISNCIMYFIGVSFAFAKVLF